MSKTSSVKMYKNHASEHSSPSKKSGVNSSKEARESLDAQYYDDQNQ